MELYEERLAYAMVDGERMEQYVVSSLGYVLNLKTRKQVVPSITGVQFGITRPNGKLHVNAYKLVGETFGMEVPEGHSIVTLSEDRLDCSLECLAVARGSRVGVKPRGGIEIAAQRWSRDPEENPKDIVGLAAKHNQTESFVEALWNFTLREGKYIPTNRFAQSQWIADRFALINTLIQVEGDPHIESELLITFTRAQLGVKVGRTFETAKAVNPS